MDVGELNHAQKMVPEMEPTDVDEEHKAQDSDCATAEKEEVSCGSKDEEPEKETSKVKDTYGNEDHNDQNGMTGADKADTVGGGYQNPGMGEKPAQKSGINESQGFSQPEEKAEPRTKKKPLKALSRKLAHQSTDIRSSKPLAQTTISPGKEEDDQVHP